MAVVLVVPLRCLAPKNRQLFDNLLLFKQIFKNSLNIHSGQMHNPGSAAATGLNEIPGGQDHAPYRPEKRLGLGMIYRGLHYNAGTARQISLPGTKTGN